jgi:hypothetical protein
MAIGILPYERQARGEEDFATLLAKTLMTSSKALLALCWDWMEVWIKHARRQ